ncbi:MAG: 50S ribosomal protein L37e [Candidatus Nanoarchaeia archaeon]|jgi:large subunit ribosomal protein L37e
MTRGTPAQGKKGRGSSHIICRRCGSHSLRKKSGECSHCGFGASSKIRNPAWTKKFVNKKRKD